MGSTGINLLHLDNCLASRSYWGLLMLVSYQAHESIYLLVRRAKNTGSLVPLLVAMPSFKQGGRRTHRPGLFFVVVAVKEGCRELPVPGKCSPLPFSGFGPGPGWPKQGGINKTMASAKQA
jgi:hypothetical protein